MQKSTGPMMRSLLVVTLVLVLLSSCFSRQNTPTVTDVEGQLSGSLDNFPTSIGRGYPEAVLLQGQESVVSVTAGERAPNFAMYLEGEDSMLLSDLEGRPVMINFWATWCPPCRAEMPEIVEAANSDDELVVLAVNVQEPDDLVQEFAEEYEMTMPVVMDRQSEVQDLYQVRGMPTSVFINRDGTIEAVWAGLIDATLLERHLDAIR